MDINKLEYVALQILNGMYAAGLAKDFSFLLPNDTEKEQLEKVNFLMRCAANLSILQAKRFLEEIDKAIVGDQSNNLGNIAYDPHVN